MVRSRCSARWQANAARPKRRLPVRSGPVARAIALRKSDGRVSDLTPVNVGSGAITVHCHERSDPGVGSGGMGQSTQQCPNRRSVETETSRLQQKILRCRRFPHGPREIRAAVPIITGRREHASLMPQRFGRRAHACVYRGAAKNLDRYFCPARASCTKAPLRTLDRRADSPREHELIWHGQSTSFARSRPMRGLTISLPSKLVIRFYESMESQPRCGLRTSLLK